MILRQFQIPIMKKICITGGIACGKSLVGDVLREAGARVIDADDVCHDLFSRGGPVADRIVAVFGKAILNRAGGIDRKALAGIIFADAAKRERLNAIMHPAARRVINAWLKAQSRGRGAKIAAALVPLVYEAGWTGGWDAIVCVAAPLSAQIVRLARKGLSEKDARARIAAQLPLAEKISRSDYVIFNAGTLAGLRQQAALVFRSIKEQTEECNGRKK